MTIHQSSSGGATKRPDRALRAVRTLFVFALTLGATAGAVGCRKLFTRPPPGGTAWSHDAGSFGASGVGAGAGGLSLSYDGGAEAGSAEYARAAALYESDCDRGVMTGCVSLGLAYKRGNGVPAASCGRAAPAPRTSPRPPRNPCRPAP